MRPTFGEGQRTVEAFLLDFDGNLYGDEVGLELVERLRGEERFEQVSDLVAQMERDVTRTAELLSQGAPAERTGTL